MSRRSRRREAGGPATASASRSSTGSARGTARGTARGASTGSAREPVRGSAVKCDIENLVIETFNNIFYGRQLESTGEGSLEQDVFASYLAGKDGVPGDKKLYRHAVFRSFIEGRQGRSGSARFSKPRLRKDPLRRFRPDSAAIMAGLLYMDMFRDRSLLNQLRLARDGEDVKALLSIDYMLDVLGRRDSPEVKGVIDSGYCIESKALQIAGILYRDEKAGRQAGTRPGRHHRTGPGRHSRTRPRIRSGRQARSRSGSRRIPESGASASGSSQGRIGQGPPQPPPMFDGELQDQVSNVQGRSSDPVYYSRGFGGIEMEDEKTGSASRTGKKGRIRRAGRMLVGAIALAAYLIAGDATIQEVVEDKVVRHGNKVYVGTMFGSTSYPLDYLYLSGRPGCRDIRSAVKEYVDSEDIPAIIEYNQMPDRSICLGEMMRIPSGLVRDRGEEDGLVEGAVVHGLDRDHPLLFPDTYYQCRGELYRRVARRVSGSGRDLDVKVKRIREYNKSHNPGFSRYGGNRRCYGRIMVPPGLARQKKWVHSYASASGKGKRRIKKRRIKKTKK